MNMATLCQLVSLTLTILNVAQGWQIRTTKMVEAPTDSPVSILDLVAKETHFKYSDRHKKVTAIKDGKVKSCFIVDYDPYWTLHDDDKHRIMSTTRFKQVKGVGDLEHLTQKAGFVIAYMCKMLKQFWMTADDLPPPPMMEGNAPEAPEPDFKEPPSREQAPPNAFRVGDSGEPGVKIETPSSGDQKPAPIPTGTQSSKYDDEFGLVPPPKVNVPESAQSVLSSVLQGPPLMGHPSPINGAPPRMPEGRANIDIPTPPPLQIWRQSHHAEIPSPPKQPKGGASDILAPPPLRHSNNIPPEMQNQPSGEQTQQQKTGDLIAPPMRNDVTDIDVPPPFHPPRREVADIAPPRSPQRLEAPPRIGNPVD